MGEEIIEAYAAVGEALKQWVQDIESRLSEATQNVSSTGRERRTNTYRSGEGYRLISLGAFFRNDTPNGVGIIMRGEDLQAHFSEMMNRYEEAWMNADSTEKDEIVDTYFEQLRTVGMTPPDKRPEEYNLVCAANIAFLEKYGFLDSDQFNGCQFEYAVNPDSVNDFP